MRIIGCDLHARQQTVAMLDTTTGEAMEKTLTYSGSNVREFYSTLPGPVCVGIEATGTMQWFLSLMEELGIKCQVGHPAKIRAAEPRKQKHDRRDADLILKLLVENRFPSIWRPSKELVDLRALLLHRHQWVRMRTRIQNALQAIALANGLRRGPALWSQAGQCTIASLPLAPHTAHRRSELQATYAKFEAEIEKLNQRVEEQADGRSGARLLMTHPGVGPITALATDVFLGDPTRFSDGKALASYVGIIPSEYSSGGRQKLGVGVFRHCACRRSLKMSALRRASEPLERNSSPAAIFFRPPGFSTDSSVFVSQSRTKALQKPLVLVVSRMRSFSKSSKWSLKLSESVR